MLIRRVRSPDCSLKKSEPLRSITDRPDINKSHSGRIRIEEQAFPVFQCVFDFENNHFILLKRFQIKFCY
jgi:hypothetical protein